MARTTVEHTLEVPSFRAVTGATVRHPLTVHVEVTFAPGQEADALTHLERTVARAVAELEELQQ